MTYRRLFSPVQIGTVNLRNRLVQTGHTKHFARDGLETERDHDYYVARAKGGIGLIITGYRLVHPTSSTPTSGYASAYLREGIPGDKILTEKVHSHGAAIFLQLNHVGVNGSTDSADDLRVLWAPSPVSSPAFREVPKQLDDQEIREVIEWFGSSAEMGREGGFDGVELHLAHSFLAHQFLSPLYNKRNDKYGGSLENRFRFSRELIEEVRRKVGTDYVVGVRIPLSDGLDGGLEVDDAEEIASLVEETRLVDYINVTIGGFHDRLSLAIAPSDTPDGWMLEMIRRVKQVTSLPVFAVGGIKSPAHAEEVLENGIADLVAITRADIADPDFPLKVREGREEEIVHCIRCNQGCISRPSRGLPMSCTVNPLTGRERLFNFGLLIETNTPKHWLVVGGGPAGMKAAETLAKRGHWVTLLEREQFLGGQVNLILKTPGRESFRWLIDDLHAQLSKASVDIRLGTKGTKELARELKPDGVVVATGAIPDRSGFSSIAPLIDRVPGGDEEYVLTLWETLEKPSGSGDCVLVLDDDGSRRSGGLVDLLLHLGKQVHVVTPFSSLFPETQHTLDQPLLYKRAFEKGLTYDCNAWVRDIRDHSVSIYNVYSQRSWTMSGIDTVVLATAQHADDELYDQVRSEFSEVYRVGDCLAPRRIDHAIYEGYLAGLEWFTTEQRFQLPTTSKDFTISA